MEYFGVCRGRFMMVSIMRDYASFSRLALPMGQYI